MPVTSNLVALQCTICDNTSEEESKWVVLIRCGHCCHLGCLTKYVRLCNEGLRLSEAAPSDKDLPALIRNFHYRYACIACGDRRNQDDTPYPLTDYRESSAGFVSLKLPKSAELSAFTRPTIECGKTCKENRLKLQKELDDAKSEIAELKKCLEAKENEANFGLMTIGVYERIVSRFSLQNVQTMPTSPMVGQNSTAYAAASAPTPTSATVNATSNTPGTKTNWKPSPAAVSTPTKTVNCGISTSASDAGKGVLVESRVLPVESGTPVKQPETPVKLAPASVASQQVQATHPTLKPSESTPASAKDTLLLEETDASMKVTNVIKEGQVELESLSDTESIVSEEFNIKPQTERDGVRVHEHPRSSWFFGNSASPSK